MITETISNKRVRAAALAGSWYPGNMAVLSKEINTLLGAASVQNDTGLIRAVIVPHAGYMYSGPTAAVTYKALQGSSYKRVLVLGPSHHNYFRGLAFDPSDAYATPLGEIPVDNAALSTITASALVKVDANVHKHEHCIEMQLPFLQVVLAPGWQLVPILVGDVRETDYTVIVDLVRPLIDTATLIVISSDFTHYGANFGYQPFPVDKTIADRLEKLDQGLLKTILAKDVKALFAYYRTTGITACGIRPIGILLHLLASTTTGSLQSYTTSGAISGNYNNSVSYMGILFRDKPRDGT